MDALALEEETNLPFASCIPGVMHACGHDAHMACLLGAAALLSRRAEELTRPVMFIFQPAEEGKGGARALVEAGLFSRFSIDRVLGVHLWPNLPYRSLRTRKGVLTALSDRIHIEIKGVGGHAAVPHDTVDPITIAAQIILTIQTMIAREVDPLESAVISFGQLEAGFAYNIIPETAHLWGTLRAFDSRVRDFLQERLETMVPSLAKAWRAQATLEYIRNYPQVVNDPETTERLFAISEPFFGADAVAPMERPILSGEDVSFYSREVPSCFALLGTGLEYGLHHPRYDVPEDLLPFVAAYEAYLGLAF
jgi:amidohydrolase